MNDFDLPTNRDLGYHDEFEINFRYSVNAMPLVHAALRTVPIGDLVGGDVAVEASVEDDQRRATDLRIGELPIIEDHGGIAVRVRTPERDRFGRTYYERYPYEWTVTMAHDTGREVEWHKLFLDDGPSLFFYGFCSSFAPATDPDVCLEGWHLVDLRVDGMREFLRETYDALSEREKKKLKNKARPGDRCYFHAVDVRTMVRALGPESLVASTEYWPLRKDRPRPAPSPATRTSPVPPQLGLGL